MTDYTKMDEATKAMEGHISEVKHYVIEKDADGNEIRVEVTEEQVKKDFNSPL